MFISTLVKCILVQSPGRPAAAGTQRLSRCSPCLPHIRRLLLTSQPAGSACGLVQAALLRLLVQLRPCCWLPVCAVCCLVLQLRCGPCGTACVLLHQRRMKAHIQCHWCCGLRKNGCHPGSQRRLHLSCCCLLSRIRSAGCCCPAAATAAAVIEWLPLVLISRLLHTFSKTTVINAICHASAARTEPKPASSQELLEEVMPKPHSPNQCDLYVK